MGKRAKREKKAYNSLLNKPILGMFVMYIWVTLASMIFSGILGLFNPNRVDTSKVIFVDGHLDISSASEILNDPISATIEIVVCLFVFFLFSLRLRKHFKGSISIKNKASIKPMLIVAVAVLLLDVATILLSNGFDTSKITLLILLQALGAGIGEEISQRAVLVPHMFRIWNDEEHLWTIGIATAVLFGLVHLPNLFMGATLSATLIQTVYAACFGLLFYAIYMYTGSIIPTMIIHFAHDFLVLIADTGMTGVIDTRTFNFAELIEELAFAAFYVIVAAWFLKKSHRPQIVAMWKEKWGMEE